MKAHQSLEELGRILLKEGYIFFNKELGIYEFTTRDGGVTVTIENRQVEGMDNGLTPELAKQYRKLLQTMRRIQCLERIEDGQIPSKPNKNTMARAALEGEKNE